LLSLQTISLFNETVSEIVCHFEGFVFRETVFGDEFGQIGAVDAAGYVVTGGNGKEGAGVVIKSDGVIEAGGLGSLFAKA